MICNTNIIINRRVFVIKRFLFVLALLALIATLLNLSGCVLGSTTDTDNCIAKKSGAGSSTDTDNCKDENPPVTVSEKKDSVYIVSWTIQPGTVVETKESVDLVISGSETQKVRSIVYADATISELKNHDTSTVFYSKDVVGAPKLEDESKLEGDVYLLTSNSLLISVSSVSNSVGSSDSKSAVTLRKWKGPYHDYSKDVPVEKSTDVNGIVLFANLDSGTYWISGLSQNKDMAFSKTIKVVNGYAQLVDIQQKPVYKLSGKVKRSGNERLDSIYVYIPGTSIYDFTDSTGYFDLGVSGYSKSDVRFRSLKDSKPQVMDSIPVIKGVINENGDTVYVQINVPRADSNSSTIFLSQLKECVSGASGICENGVPELDTNLTEEIINNVPNKVPPFTNKPWLVDLYEKSTAEYDATTNTWMIKEDD